MGNNLHYLDTGLPLPRLHPSPRPGRLRRNQKRRGSRRTSPPAGTSASGAAAAAAAAAAAVGTGCRAEGRLFMGKELSF